jgi:chromodomain-helicase-DNA-binding protein 6
VDGPMCRLSADAGLDGGPIVAKSATAAWAEVLRRVTAARAALGEEPKKTAISGPEFFGYSLPHIRLLVEELPGVAECVEYQHLMERKPAGQKSEVTEAKGAGRAEETNARAADE